MGFDVCAFPVEVDLALFAYDGPGWEVAPFRHRSGWLAFGRAYAETAFGDREAILVAAVSDHGETYGTTAAARLLELPASFPRLAEDDPPESVEEALDNAYWDFLGAVDLDCLRLLGEAQDALDERIRGYEAECTRFELEIWASIRTLRKERRALPAQAPERGDIDLRIEGLESMADDLALERRHVTTRMRHEIEGLEEAVLSGLTDKCEFEHMGLVRWRARSRVSSLDDLWLPSARGQQFTVDAWNARVAGQTFERVAAMRVFRFEQDEE
ncbi:MAG: hypothetical protein ABSC22_02005 [Roseiarcus sp.]|jgi:hypothetical protein